MQRGVYKANAIQTVVGFIEINNDACVFICLHVLVKTRKAHNARIWQILDHRCVKVGVTFQLYYLGAS